MVNRISWSDEEFIEEVESLPLSGNIFRTGVYHQDYSLQGLQTNPSKKARGLGNPGP